MPRRRKNGIIKIYIFNRIQRKKSGWRIVWTNKKIDIKILDLNTIIFL